MSDAIPDLNETDLIDGLRRGDPIVFRQCFDWLYYDLVAFAIRLVGSQEVAQDIVQDVFIGVFTRGQALEVRGPLQVYLFGAVRNHALNALRREAVVQRVANGLSEMNTSPAMGSASPNPESNVEEQDLNVHMARALAELPERQRSAMMLRWEYGLTTTEIAQTLGISPPAVSQLLTKAISHLRKILPEF